MVSIAAGRNLSLAITRGGALWVWGANNIVPGDRSGPKLPAAPQRVPGLPPIVAISTSHDHTLALADDGTVWEWGAASSGSAQERPSPAPPSSRVERLAGVTGIAAGARHALALMQDGTVRTWGSNGSSQLGDPTTDGKEPAQVPGLKDVRMVAAGQSHSVALMQDGSVFTWRNNAVGELGLPVVPLAETPVTLSRTETIGPLPVLQVEELAVPAPTAASAIRPGVQGAEVFPFSIRMAGFNQHLSRVAFDAEGRRAAVTMFGKGTVEIFDLVKGVPVQSLPLRSGAGTGVAFSPDGKTLAAGNAGATRQRPAGEHQEIKLVGVEDTAGAVTLQLFDLATGMESALLEMPKSLPCLGGAAVNSVAFALDEKRLYAGSGGLNCGQMGVWDLATGRLLYRREDRQTLTTMALSPDGKHLAKGSGTEVDKPVEILPREIGKVVASLQPVLYGTVQDGEFSPRGDFLAVVRSTAGYRPPTGTENVVGGIELWRTADWQLQETIPVPWKNDGGGVDWVNSISFSPDGALLARCGRTNQIEILNLATKKKWIIPRHASFISFSPDGKHLATLTETDFSILTLPGESAAGK